MAETNGNGNGNGVPTKLTIPISWAMTAIGAMTSCIIALAGYSARINADMVRLTEKSVSILQKMDARSALEFDRVHAEHLRLLEKQDNLGSEMRGGRQEFDKTGKLGAGNGR